MKRKIFISISLPDRTKKRLIKATGKWRDLPVKWAREDNLHITLSFLGYIGDEVIADICERVRKASGDKEIFDIEFDLIELGPTQEEPRLIWLTGKANENLRELQEDIEKELGIFINSKKAFQPHITLGRIRKHKWEAFEKPPKISEKFPLIITANSVDVIASKFIGEDTEYAVIESCPLV